MCYFYLKSLFLPYFLGSYKIQFYQSGTIIGTFPVMLKHKCVIIALNTHASWPIILSSVQICPFFIFLFNLLPCKYWHSALETICHNAPSGLVPPSSNFPVQTFMKVKIFFQTQNKQKISQFKLKNSRCLYVCMYVCMYVCNSPEMTRDLWLKGVSVIMA